jgi:hypothetical protein
VTFILGCHRWLPHGQTTKTMAGKHQEANGRVGRRCVIHPRTCPCRRPSWKRDVVDGLLRGYFNKGIFRIPCCGNQHASRDGRGIYASDTNRRKLCGHASAIKHGFEGGRFGNIVDDFFVLCGHVESANCWQDCPTGKVSCAYGNHRS